VGGWPVRPTAERIATGVEWVDRSRSVSRRRYDAMGAGCSHRCRQPMDRPSQGRDELPHYPLRP